MKYKDRHGVMTDWVSTGMKDRRVAEGLVSMVERDAERLAAGMLPQNLRYTAKFLGLDSPVGKNWPESVAAYLNELTRQGSGPDARHHIDSRILLKRIERECGWKGLLDIHPGTFTDFLGRLAAAGRAPRTQNRYFDVLRAACNFWVRVEWLEKSPLDRLRPVKVGQAGRRRLRRAYTALEFQRLLAAPQREHCRIAYRVAAFSGFRYSELRRLEKEDCTPTGPRPRWHVDGRRTKNGLAVRLPMAPECAEALAGHWQALPAGAKLLSVPDKDTFKEHRQKAGIAPQDERGRWADFHSLRYTFCLWMSKLYPIEIVSKLMRHGSLNLTSQIYLDLGLDRESEGAWIIPRIPDLGTPGDAPSQVNGCQPPSGDRSGDRSPKSAPWPVGLSAG
jgi:integrase